MMAELDNIALESSHPEPIIKKRGPWSAGVFCSRIKLLVLLVVFVILVIIIIVLAALLGAARSKHADKDARVSKPTSRPVPSPTTPGTEAWWQVRLPRDVLPVHYNLMLNITVDLPRYDGHVEIYVNITSETDIILVHTHSINISHVTVGQVGQQDSFKIKRRFWFKKNEFYVIQVNSVLSPGRYVVTMKFAAFFAADLRGLYRDKYKYPDGKLSNYAATQFEPVRARWAFPCFDEPSLKATFNVTIAHRPDYVALSNMPIYRSELVNGQKHDHFEKTVVMPTYLLAFVVGDYKYNEIITKNGVKMRVYSRPAVLHETGFALTEGSKVMTFFEQYFDVKYSLPKADMIGLPDFGPGAMENWGLITYKEVYVLWKPSISSEANKRSTASIIAHELAHQWFGNIVTMKWWDDLWLNEGFASYMTYVGDAVIHPTWGVKDSFIVESFSRAIALDGLASSHPVKVNVNSPAEISEIFDAISYTKGASILRMLESFLGNETFVKGLTRYINKHAFSNAETDDLWQALKEESCSRSCVDVKHVMDTWTLQMGYPVVKLTKHNSSTYLVTQKHFLFDETANISNSKYKSPFNYTWVVPFSFVSTNNKKKQIHWMDRGSIYVNDNSPWIKGNHGHEGYYIVNYEDSNWKALKDQLNNNHKVLSISNRAGLIFDAFTLASGGQLSYDKAFDITAYIKGETEYVPWKTLDKHLEYLQQILSPTGPAYKKLQKYLIHQSKDQYNKLGFTDTGSHLEIFKRGLFLEMNCKAGVRSCINNVTERFTKWMNNKLKIAPNLRSLVYQYGVAHGGVKEWDFVYDQYQKAESPSEQYEFLRALSASSESWVIARYLEYAFDPTKIVKSKIRYLFKYVAANPTGTPVAWSFVRLNWDRITKLYGDELFAYRRLMPSLTKYFRSSFELNELRKFNKEVEQRTGTQSATMLQKLEEVKANVKWLEKNAETIENWLTKYITDNNIP